MQFYSITDDIWTTKADMPRGLNHANAAVVDGKIYVLGGLAETGEAGEGKRVWGAVPDSWVYDPVTDLWKTIPGVPAGEERGSAAVGTYQSNIYLAAKDVYILSNYTSRNTAPKSRHARRASLPTGFEITEIKNKDRVANVLLSVISST